MDSDCTDIVNNIYGENYMNNIKNSDKIALNLSQKKKIDFLKDIKKEDSFYENDREKQRNYFKNLKCKNMAVKILNTRNLNDLILINKYITKEKGQYMKIKKREEFEKVIQTFVDKNFSLKLIKEETYIKKREDKLEKIVEDIKSSLNHAL